MKRVACDRVGECVRLSLGGRFFSVLLCIALLSLLTTPVVAKEYLLYYLGGQSNMEGFGQVSELPEELQGPVSNVWIFHGNKSPDRVAVDGRGVWSQLRPGHGFGFSSDGKKQTYSNKFGVELSFARRLQELYPNANIALIKYAKLGTSIDIKAGSQFGCWEPDFRGGEGEGRGVNQYDHFLATIRNAFAVRDIDGDGEEDTLTPAGIVWMQGESDAWLHEEAAKRYEANLKRLMDLIRPALRSDDLPVAIGRITGKNWLHLETVRAAQASFVEKDECAALVTTTDNYKYSDPYHYDSAGYIDLGVQFAEAISRLNKKKHKVLVTGAELKEWNSKYAVSSGMNKTNGCTWTIINMGDGTSEQYWHCPKWGNSGIFKGTYRIEGDKICWRWEEIQAFEESCYKSYRLGEGKYELWLQTPFADHPFVKIGIYYELK